jgi:hypothetical protein
VFENSGEIRAGTSRSIPFVFLLMAGMTSWRPGWDGPQLLHAVDATASGLQTAEDDAQASPPGTPLPTTLNWNRLPTALQEIWRDGMDVLDEACKEHTHGFKGETSRDVGELSGNPAPRSAGTSAKDVIENLRVHPGAGTWFAQILPGPRAPAGRQQDAEEVIVTIRPRPQTTLNEVSAIMIFLSKHMREKCPAKGCCLATRLAREYGVTCKAVRDIWRMRTWRRATEPFWSAQERKAALATRRFEPLEARKMMPADATDESSDVRPSRQSLVAICNLIQ